MSPLLWVLVLNDILVTLERDGVKVVAYADDVAILISGKFLDTLSDLAGRAIRKLDVWAREKGLNVNPGKTEMVLFTNSNNIRNFKNPRLKGERIELKAHAKYLGVILDSKLLWKLNVEDRIIKANKAFYTCNRLFGRKWGLKPNVTKWVWFIHFPFSVNDFIY